MCPGKPLLNSVTAEKRSLEAVLPLVKEYGAAVIALTMDDSGIPKTAEDRLGVVGRIVAEAGRLGIPPEDIVIDCLALTVGADPQAGKVTLDSIALIRDELGVNINLGASNVSFGLPDRKVINVAYLALAISRGMTTAITDPTVQEIQTTLLACDLLMGRDEYGMNWIKAYRKRSKA